MFVVKQSTSEPRARHALATIPDGVADYFWEDAAQRRALEHDLLALFRAWGYGDVLLPAFEYVETLEQRANAALRAELYRFVDRDGSTLALRADMTIPVARLVATRLHDVAMPQRFCYAGSIFRYGETHGGTQREFTQAGIELLGADSPAADAEVLALTARAMEHAGLPDTRIAVGHLGFFHALLAALALSESAQSALIAAVDRNSDAALADFLQQTQLDDTTRAAVMQIPRLSGDDPAAVVADARALCLNDGMRAAVDNLAAILDALHAHALNNSIYADLTEIHNLGYYTGITFEVLTPTLGYAVASGGRYDNLVGTFGAPCPAVGAAFTLDRLLLARRLRSGRAGAQPRPLPPDVFVQAAGSAACHALIETWRALGLRVAVDLQQVDLQQTDTRDTVCRAAVMQRAQALGAPFAAIWCDDAIILCEDGQRERTLNVTEAVDWAMQAKVVWEAARNGWQ